MGDRCYLEAHVRERDLEAFAKIVGKDLKDFEPADPSGFHVIEEQANYAWASELEEAAGEDLTFEAWWNAGGEYGDGKCVCVEGDLVEVDCEHQGGMVVPVDEKGDPDPDSVKRIKRYLARYKEFCEILKQDEKNKEEIGW